MTTINPFTRVAHYYCNLYYRETPIDNKGGEGRGGGKCKIVKRKEILKRFATSLEKQVHM